MSTREDAADPSGADDAFGSGTRPYTSGHGPEGLEPTPAAQAYSAVDPAATDHPDAEYPATMYRDDVAYGYADAPYADATYADVPYADVPYADVPYADAPYADAPSVPQTPSGPYAAQPGQVPYPSYPPVGYPAMPPAAGGNGGNGAKALQIGLAVLIVALLGVGGFLAYQWQSGDDEPQADSPAAAPTTTLTTTTTGTTTVAVDPATALREQADQDFGALSGPLNNTWAAQVSAKQPGLVAEGKTWTDQDILQQFEGFAARYPNAKLLWSGQWRVFNHTDWWVTVVADGFTSPEAANSWCRSQRYGPDDCFAKLISTTAGPTGSTVYWK